MLIPSRRTAAAYAAGVGTPLAIQWGVYLWLLHTWRRNGLAKISQEPTGTRP